MEPKPYYETIEAFMREIEPSRVKALALVALLEDSKHTDVIATWTHNASEAFQGSPGKPERLVWGKDEQRSGQGPAAGHRTACA